MKNFFFCLISMATLLLPQLSYAGIEVCNPNDTPIWASVTGVRVSPQIALISTFGWIRVEPETCSSLSDNIEENTRYFLSAHGENLELGGDIIFCTNPADEIFMITMLMDPSTLVQFRRSCESAGLRTSNFRQIPINGREHIRINLRFNPQTSI